MASPQSKDLSVTQVGEINHSESASDTQDDVELQKQHATDTELAPGVARAQATQLVWGKYGRVMIWVGLALMMTVYEVDNTTVYVYQNYAPSEFNMLSQKATIATAAIIVAAVFKPPIAKISDVIGRAPTYCITISFYLIGYILCAAARNFGMYAAGVIFYAIGQTGTNILNDVVISEHTSTRWRSFALSFLFFPFIIMPWVGGLICESVVNGIGWRWGIGMLAFIFPCAASVLIVTLFIFDRRARKAEIVTTKRVSTYEFFSYIDGGGLLFLCLGFALFFLPISLASTSPARWSTPWIAACLAIGAALLVGLIPYEHFVAKRPIVPPRYLTNPTIVIAIATIFLDALAFQATHVYMYSWVVMVHDYDVKKATYLQYINGSVQCLVAIVAGYAIGKWRRFKWFLFAACVIRTIGYGVMLRLRGTENSDAELFIVQCIQGIGTGVINIVTIVAMQIVVPHAEMAQVTAFNLLCAFLGSGVGSSVAGGIYTNYFQEKLRDYMGPNASEVQIRAIYDSITDAAIPAWGTPERDAANYACSDVMRLIVLVALCVSAPVVILTFFMPNHELKDDVRTLLDENDAVKEGDLVAKK